MEEKETIVIDIQLDAKGVADQLAQVNKNIADVKAQNASLRKEVKDGTKTWRDVSEQLAVNEQRLKTLTTTQKVLTNQYNAQVGTNKRLGDSLKEMGSELTALKNEYRSLSATERESAKGQELLKHIQDLDTAMKEADYTMGDHQRNVGNYPDAVKPVTAQLREMTQELIRLRMEGKANTEEYNELLKKTGEMKDAMADAQNEVKQMASDTSTLNSVLAGAQAAAGAFSVALGVMNLVGDKDSETAKELAEAQRKLQSAIAITTGLQALQNALQKESALMMGINKLRMLAAAAAQRAYAAATRDAEAAQVVFNKVAKSNIYVWLASVILTVVGAIAAFTRGSKDQKEEIEKVNVELQHQVDILKKLQEGYDTLNQRIVDSLENNIEKLKAQGATTEEIRAAEDALFENRKQAFKDEEKRIGEEIMLYGRRSQRYEENLRLMNDLSERRIEFLRKGDEESARFYQNEINNLQVVIDQQKKHLDVVTDFWNRRDQFYNQRRQQEAERKRDDEAARQRQIEAARAANERWKAEVKAIREANKELIDLANLANLAEKNEQQALDAVEKKIDNILQKLNEAKEAQKFAQEVLEGVDFNNMMDRLERQSNPLYDFARTYEENAQAIQETSSALESSFSSLSQMYEQMANDESKTEEERAKAAKKAKAWAGIQVASNAGAAMAKGISGAMDAPTLVGKFAALATMTASLTAAIAQAKALLESHEHGGVIGNKFIGATRGKDDVTITARRGEMMLNADQQKRLYDIANGSATTNLTASLVEALQAMPAPVLVYSEFRRFTDRVATLDDAAKLH